MHVLDILFEKPQDLTALKSKIVTQVQTTHDADLLNKIYVALNLSSFSTILFIFYNFNCVII